MKTVTTDDIPKFEEAARILGLDDGLAIVVQRKHDEGMGPPWKEHDGHGIVSEWTTREKRPGERVLIEDRRMRRYYDVAATTQRAREESWGDLAECEKRLGRKPTSGELASWAVDRDFERLHRWCNDEWYWMGVVVKLLDADDKVVAENSLWGVESDGDYWREVAADMANTLLRGYAEEQAEAAYWAARDVETVAQ